MKNKNKMCEWHICSEKATCVEASEGRLLNLCTLHRKALKAQKKANNNS